MASAPLPAAHPTGGLPQFDLAWWPGEIVWTLAIFLVLYVLFTRVFVPRISGTIDAREDRIAGDIGAARKVKQEADAQVASAAAETAQARASAQKLALDAKAKAAAEAAQRDALEEAKLAEQLAKAEAQIATTREQAMAHVREIATDTAGAIIEKLTGKAATSTELTSAQPG
jgi:F-type H+-transporting ATPase subunit b